MASGKVIGCFGLTEPDFGSDPAGMRTSARKAGSDWVLNGNKTWITNGGIAGLAVVWARSDDGVLGFLVPRGTRGFSTRDIHRKLSLRASVSSELILEDVRLPDGARLPGVSGLKGPLSCLNERDSTSDIAGPRCSMSRSMKPGSRSCGRTGPGKSTRG